MDNTTTISTNPRKFGFDADFKAENTARDAADQQQTLLATIAAEVAAGRLFDAQGFDAGMQAAEKRGFDAGMQAASASHSQQLVALWQQAIEKLDGLLSAEQNREINSQQIALTSTLLAVKKAFPSLAEKVAHTQVASVLQTVFEHQSQEARLVVRVADAVLDDVIQQVEQQKQQHAFMGKVVVLADNALQLGDCRVEWADGGLERLQKQTQRGLEEALVRVLQTVTTKQAPIDNSNLNPDNNFDNNEV